MEIHSYIEKLRALPDKQKKIILWTIVSLLALSLAFLWLKTSISRFEKMEESIKNVNMPSIDYNIEEKK